MTIQNILHKIDENGERYLLLPLYALIVITIFMEVFRRFALSYSSIWAEEIARYAFIYVSWIGASAAIKERAHIRIDLILPVVGDKLRAVIMIFGAMIGEIANETGGAERIAHATLRVAGKRRLPAAMGVTGYVISIPVFVDVA